MARGVVREMGTDGLFICRPGGGFADACFGVPLTGVGEADLPDWSNGRSSLTSITGTWIRGKVDVADVRPFTPPPAEPRYAPCEEPPEGWLPDPSGATDDEDAARRLSDELAAHPDLYAGTWLAEADPRTSTTRATVAVVGTAGNVDSVRQTLEQLYPYNLCVTAVEYSEAELRAVKERLNRADGPGNANVVPPWTNRVMLVLPVLDAGAAQLVGPDADKVIVNALVWKALP